MTQKNTSTKEKQAYRHKEQTCGCQGGAGGSAPGVWGQHMQTTVYRTDKPQGPTV